MFKIQKRIIYAIEAVVDIALNSGLKPAQNISIAKRQKIPKRYLEQTLQILVKNNILVGSRGPKGGYRLAKERRKIKVSDIIRTVTNDESKELTNDPGFEVPRFLGWRQQGEDSRLEPAGWRQAMY